MPNILILGGTTQATALAAAVADRELPATLSYAGRTARPRAQPIPIRIGGFGGADGLAAYLRDKRITHLIDATHPFAAQISANAIAAARITGVPLVALGRPAWRPVEGDRWTIVPTIEAAVAALDRPPQRVMLALGRMHVSAFAAQPQHRYLLRFVEQPDARPDLPHHDLVIDRGPFTVEGDASLMRDHGIQLIVCKNAGGNGADAKLHAARMLGLPVTMIERPAVPARLELDEIDAVLRWIDHVANLGV
ncbi:MAG TPA: cobalt-precorrin-6A reductase [Sphingomonas sp.]